MPRKGQIPRREPVPDPKFDSPLATRFINSIMKEGKRSIAEGAFYRAMKIVEEKAGQDAMTVLKQAMTNVKPILEVKSRRVGGADLAHDMSGDQLVAPARGNRGAETGGEARVRELNGRRRRRGEYRVRAEDEQRGNGHEWPTARETPLLSSVKSGPDIATH